MQGCPTWSVSVVTGFYITNLFYVHIIFYFKKTKIHFLPHVFTPKYFFQFKIFWTASQKTLESNNSKFWHFCRIVADLTGCTFVSKINFCFNFISMSNFVVFCWSVFESEAVFSCIQYNTSHNKIKTKWSQERVKQLPLGCLKTSEKVKMHLKKFEKVNSRQGRSYRKHLAKSKWYFYLICGWLSPQMWINITEIGQLKLK